MIGQISPFVNPVRYTLPDDFYANNGDHRTDEIIAFWDKVFDPSRYMPDWDPEPIRHTSKPHFGRSTDPSSKKVEHLIAK